MPDELALRLGIRERARGRDDRRRRLREHPGDPEAQALAFEAHLGAELAGRFDLSAARDRACQRAYRGEVRWEDPHSGHGLIETTLTARAGDDAEIFRAVMRRDMQLDPVTAIAADAALLDRARTLPPNGREASERRRQPTREALLELIGTVGAGS